MPGKALHDMWTCPAPQDFGHNWVNLTQNSGGAVASFWDFDWGAALHRGEARRGFPDETILASVYESAAAMKVLLKTLNS